MSSFDNFDLDFLLESTQSSLEKEFLVVEEHCKMIEWKCEASKAKVMEVKGRFDKLLGDEKRVFPHRGIDSSNEQSYGKCRGAEGSEEGQGFSKDRNGKCSLIFDVKKFDS
jgi:hypothetical protein